MPMSYAELKAMLDVDEPDYEALAITASGAFGHVKRMAASSNVALATKAVSLAGYLGSSKAVPIVAKAASSSATLLRVAAAQASAMLPPTPAVAALIEKLLGDREIGVVKVAVGAAETQCDPGLPAVVRVKAAKRLAAAARPTARVSASAGSEQTRTTEMPTGQMTNKGRPGRSRTMPPGRMAGGSSFTR